MSEDGIATGDDQQLLSDLSSGQLAKNGLKLVRVYPEYVYALGGFFNGNELYQDMEWFNPHTS